MNSKTNIARIVIVVLLLSIGSFMNVYAEYLHTVYLSSQGSDKNPGTEALPKKRITHLPAEFKKDTRVMLRRGDVFYDVIHDYENCLITAYGEGPDPVVCGFKILDIPRAWTRVDSRYGIWRLDLTDSSIFSGFPPGTQRQPGNFNNIGCLYIIASDSIIGNLVDSYDKLAAPGDFFTRAGELNSVTVVEKPFRYLYLRSNTDPAKLGRVALSTGNHGIYHLTDCEVSDIAVVGFSCHGAAGLDRTTLRRCTFDMIGGSIYYGDSPWVRYGNGVEVWDNCSDITVADCTFAHVFDCATTIQGAAGPERPPRNIRFVNNAIFHCRQCFVYFRRNIDTPEYPGCEFSSNIGYMTGESGFSDNRWSNADVMCWLDDTNVDAPISFKITDNVFFGGSYFCSPVANPAMRDNTVYIFPRQFLNSYWTLGYPHIVVTEENFDSAVALFRARFGDNSRITLLDPALNDTIRDQYFTLEKSVIDKINYSTPRIF